MPNGSSTQNTMSSCKSRVEFTLMKHEVAPGTHYTHTHAQRERGREGGEIRLQSSCSHGLTSFLNNSFLVQSPSASIQKLQTSGECIDLDPARFFNQCKRSK